MIDDLLAGWRSIEAAEPAYTKAEDQYDGKAAETFASERVEKAIGSTGEDYKMPLIATAVDTLAERCELRRVSVPTDEAATAWVEETSEANNLDVYFPELITNTLKLGDYYLMVWDLWGEGETPEPASTDSEQELEQVGIEFTIHDPRRVRLFYDPENERRKSYALKRWNVPDPSNAEQPLWRVDLYYPDHIEHWISLSGQPPEKPEAWVNDSPDDVNPHGAIPFFHFRTELLYGRSIMERGYGAQNAFTKTSTTHLATVDTQAFPWRYLLTDPDADLDSNNDDPDYFEGDDANATASDGPQRPTGGQGTSQRGGPGTLSTFQGIKAAGQFDPADPKVFTDPGNEYIDVLAMLTRTPIHSFKPRVQPESGEAKRIAEGPLVKRALRMQTILATSVKEAWRFAFKIAKKHPKGPLHISWSPAYIADGVDDWQRIQLQIMTGVPQEVALIEAGYEKDQVQTWLDESDEQMGLRDRMKLALEGAQALQAAGLAGVLGVTVGASGTMGTPSGPVYDQLTGLLQRASIALPASAAVTQ